MMIDRDRYQKASRDKALTSALAAMLTVVLGVVIATLIGQKDAMGTSFFSMAFAGVLFALVYIVVSPIEVWIFKSQTRAGLPK